jgi:DNA polymerase III alpha subunit (gram-positive type)
MEHLLKMNRHKELWLDCETTGLSTHKNHVHQLAGIIVIDGKVIEEFDLKIRPPQDTEISAYCRDEFGITWDLLNTYPNHVEQYGKFIAMLDRYVNHTDPMDKYTFYGFNVNFDMRMVKAYLSKQNRTIYSDFIHNEGIDVLSIARQALKHKRHLMKNFKLGTVMEFLDIEVAGPGLHDAKYDILGTREIFLKLQNDKI